MKRIVLVIMSLILVGSLFYFAVMKNNEVPEDIEELESLTSDEELVHKKEEPKLAIDVFFDEDGKSIEPPKPLPITEEWADGYLPQLDNPNPYSPYVTLNTSLGSIRMVLYPEAAPLTVKNFIVHCQEGYYDNTNFHRIEKDFMIQGGDPTGKGGGGESIYGTPFRDEINEHLHHFRGALAMATSGTSSNGSQFYIVQGRRFQQTYRDEKEESYKMQMEINRASTEVYVKALDYLFYDHPTETEFEEYITINTNKANEKLRKGYVKDEMIEKVMELYPDIGGSPHLDYNDTVFGQVVSGMSVVDAIGKAKEGEVIIYSTYVENSPY